ncbi:MAG: replication factor C large subunit [Methanothrix sp.]|uniref:Replication factor C large subunit n=1 Tax=Methanothrix thermoacetophila (strain DSM 6194 / JCM 14653 / NBRC 101360 / PT) TaxID=349307 RepID=RFCL_METTP|nr:MULTISPECIES: replication factor C large subunit [Methanothrix]A0B6D7.1 RecName: Full=Replication factor C large subunit; Short=RFC large subunit; AltName: Full=Clamp loader large subunit [Methanothrix thermoacetophila PT]ABK14261.1 replication factor C large subunit [Methanothrix thermoacetophila PT]MBC7080446.1 replication factor C large subunit [Methanothrix sp.]NPU87713.1 replication factor C large subunit [Methanothrix sp.]
MTSWAEKYRPKNLDGILGNAKAVSELRAWAMAWEKGRPEVKCLILYGPPGVGKTSAALALASEMDWDYIELNASDQRTAEIIKSIAGPASQVSTFSGRRRLVILDEADNLHGTYDRGGAAAILRVIKNATQPVILIANEYYNIEKPLRDACRGVQFRSIRAQTIASLLREICRSEGIECEPEAVMHIAAMSGGDLRSAINDLEAAARGLKHLRLEDVATSERDVKASIFRVLDSIFKGEDSRSALEATYQLDESPEDLIHWIDENLPIVYKDRELAKGFECLSRADIFLGRVRRRQNYTLWRYAAFLMTGGVRAVSSKVRRGYTQFRPPSLWKRLGQTRKARSVRDSAARKIAAHCHVSTSYARSELLNFVGALLRSKKTGAAVAASLGLNIEEIALLTGSSPTTKKVQKLFEDAQKIIEAEQIAMIDRGLKIVDREIEKPEDKAMKYASVSKEIVQEKRQRSLFDF